MQISSNLTSKVKTGIKAGMLGLAMLPVQLPALAKDTVQFSHSAAATSGLANFNAKLANKAENLMKNITAPFKSENAVLTDETRFKPTLIEDIKDPIIGTKLEGALKPLVIKKDVFVYEVIDRSKALSKELAKEVSEAKKVIVAYLKNSEGKYYNVIRADYTPIKNSNVTTYHSDFFGGPDRLTLSSKLTENGYDGTLVDRYTCSNGTEYQTETSFGYDEYNEPYEIVLGYMKSDKKTGEKAIIMSKYDFDKEINAIAKKNHYDVLVGDF